MHNVYRSKVNPIDNLLLLGQMPTVTDGLLIGADQNLKKGSVLGLKTDTEEAYLVDQSKSDGTELPYAILASDITTDETSCLGAVYLSGEFNANELIVGNGSIEDYQIEMRKIGLIVRSVQNRGE